MYIDKKGIMKAKLIKSDKVATKWIQLSCYKEIQFVQNQLNVYGMALGNLFS